MSANIGYRPKMHGPIPTQPPNYTRGNAFSCHGTPEGSILGGVGDTCCDLDSNILYVKVRGSSVYGWIANGTCDSVSGGRVEVYSGAAGSDPNGVVTAERPAVYYTKAGGVWMKTEDGNDALNWTEIIAE